MAKELNGDEVVRRDHLARNAAGADGIRHLTEIKDRGREARERLAAEVANIGARNRKEAIARAKGAELPEITEPVPAGFLGDLGTDSGDQFSDEQLRAIIEQETGKAPHHRTGRSKLVETFNDLNAAQG